MKFKGIYLPIITPLKDNEVDFASYKKLIDYYSDKGISGFVPLGTTGESPTLSDHEYESVLDKTVEFVDGRLPIIVGLGGNYTDKLLKTLKTVNKYPVQGLLSVTPYYNRPDQRGIYEHFKKIAESTSLDIIMYNIPYRTGRNIELETIYKLAEIPNISGIKDCNGEFKQTTSLILNPPKDFSVLTGEDALLYSTLTHGGHGAILATAHIKTEKFVEMYNKVKENDHEGALEVWKELISFIPLLFEEPNPTPIKYILQQMGLIESSEVRLPLLPISDKLQEKLNWLF